MQTLTRFVFSIVFFSFSLSAVPPRSLLAPIKLDSPRDTMRSYYDAMTDYQKGIDTGDPLLKNRINDAIRCFDLTDTGFVLQAEERRNMVILLKEVIDRVIILDYSKIPEKSGTANNPLLRWRLKDTEIAITRVQSGDHAGEYLFSRETSERVSEFYSKVKHLPYLPGSGQGARYREPWQDYAIPEWAKEHTLGLRNWQWIGLFLSIIIGLIIKKIIEIWVRILKKFTARTQIDWDDKIIHAVERPIGLIGASLWWLVSIYLLRFEGISLMILKVIVQLVFSVSAIWLCYRLVDVLTDWLADMTSRTKSTLDDQLVPLLRKALRIFVVIFGILVTFQNLGFNVLSVLAGLGLGGLAFALAAKDTCANFFGSIMILIDRPFNIGDWVVTSAAEGTVEEIGFRSTRIRTFYNSVITIPNSVLANANIDNMGKRQYRRIKTFIGLTYDTPPAKMEAFLEGIKNIIKANPYTRKDYYHVVFNRYSESSLDVMLYCFLEVPDWGIELVEKQNIFLEILRLAEKIEVEFAFPTQTLHMESFPGQTSANQASTIENAELSRTVLDFGPDGKLAMPSGQGVFTPPFKEAGVTGGDSDE